ncbi:Protein mesh [Aphelenchoides besseyi]|nr:Protein mesh [Aphelenchoides besseyi]
MRWLISLSLWCGLANLAGGNVASVPSNTNLLDDQRRRPQGGIEPLTTSQIIFLNTVSNVQQPGVHSTRNLYGLPGNQTPRITAQNLHEIDWTQVDRRIEDGWWHLYPFGEKYFDRSLSNRPWMEKQIDLDFFLPYFGFRFNYTFIFHEGFIAFSYPWYIQAPYTFPNPHWPNRPDPSLIAAFMTDQIVQHVGNTRISNVWFRIIERPPSLIGYNNLNIDYVQQQRPQPDGQPQGVYSYDNPRYYRTYRGRQLKTQEGRIEDPEFLDLITNDIRHGMVGARGWKADYAILITWERMAYGGAPKIIDVNKYEQAKRWQNTYQMLVATDEIRTYCLFNYANINWTSSATAGALTGGRGGHQSALVGFNGGNGTGYHELPYSAEGNSYKLVQYGSTQIAGRWVSRVDEQIQYGGCSNESRGTLETSQQYGNMLGGFALNVSGPCYRPTDIIKFVGLKFILQFDELTIDCERVDRYGHSEMCNTRQSSPVELKLSVDGGKNYPWWNKFYVLQPGLSRRRLNLVNDPREPRNNWNSFDARNLTLTWEYENITANYNAEIDISLWGYFEDTETHYLKQIGYIAKRQPNSGSYTFNPISLAYDYEADPEAWRFYRGGIIQVRVSENWLNDRGDGLYWSSPVSFGWFYQRKWEYEYGRDWAFQICQEWYDEDGRRENFVMELEPKVPCPCTLDQALVDVGRFTALPDCDMEGDHRCYYTVGAKHCVLSSFSVWTGAGQVCCYDYEGWLMFSDDFEYNDQYLRFYSAGVPFRAHPFGSHPYKRPPYVPTLSNLYNDLLPYDFCCKWAGHCEFYFWRRQTSTCQMYKPPALATIYGGSHFNTYDGLRYSFHGKGYYILSMMKSPHHDLMIQGRLEQPPQAIWGGEVRSTVLTGLAARDNESSVVQIFARKDFRTWRYKTDIYVDGLRIYFDMPWKKIQTFKGVTLRNPPRNMNQSEIDIMFSTGVGIRVLESRGLLNVIIALPDNYREVNVNEFYRHDHDPFAEETFWSFSSLFTETTTQFPYWRNDPNSLYGGCASHYRTLGLLGTYNGEYRDETTTPDCSIVPTSYPQSAADARQLYYQFGEKWRLDRNHQLPKLFQADIKPIYDPLSFANPNYEPVFDPWLYSNYSVFESFLFSLQEVKVACQGLPECESDTLNFGRREFGLDTLDFVKKFEPVRERAQHKRKHKSNTVVSSSLGSSCGPLVKNRGVLKYPQGNNYLDGVTVTFSCKPEYFLHGDTQRKCINGTWSPGWWPWCRERSEEYALKWMTGVLSTVAIVLALVLIFVMFIMYGRERQRMFISRKYPRVSFIPDPTVQSPLSPSTVRSPTYDEFKGKSTSV